MGKTLVLYVFHVMNDRVTYFLNNCIFEDENIDFIVISNDKNNVFDTPPYVKKLFRDNVGFDFGGWGEALLANDLYKNYDKFIFANSSIIGPFLRPHEKNKKWTDFYLDGISGDVKLFGSTINAQFSTHVQSYIFSADRECIEFLINKGIFVLVSDGSDTFFQTIVNKEVGMSGLVLENGWNIGCLLPPYKGVDFRKQYTAIYPWDFMYPQFRNTMWNEYDIVFIKGNRINLIP